MTSVFREEDLIRNTVARGVHVEFVLINPDWLSMDKPLCALVDDYYNRTNFVDTVRESLNFIENMKQELNSEYGAGKVEVRTINQLVYYSGTIADYGTDKARGYIEFHLYRAPLGRFRMQVVDYMGSPMEDPSLVYHWLASLSRMTGRDYLSPLRTGPKVRAGAIPFAASVDGETFLGGEDDHATDRRTVGE
jgi:hypothetical protein